MTQPITPDTNSDGLDEILERLVEDCHGTVMEQFLSVVEKNLAFYKATQAINQYMLDTFTELIGETTSHDLGSFTLDELDRLETAATYAVAQDALRAELCKLAKERFKP